MFPAILLRVDLTGKPEDEADCQNSKARRTYLKIRVDLEHMVDMQDRANIVLEAEQLNTVASYEVSVVYSIPMHILKVGKGAYWNRLPNPSSIHDPDTHGECIYIVMFGSFRSLNKGFFRLLVRN